MLTDIPQAAGSILRACATAIGIAAFAILLSYATTEVVARATAFESPALQPLSFQILQLALAAIVLWPTRHDIVPRIAKPILLLLSTGVGLALAAIYSADVQSLLGISSATEHQPRLQKQELLFATAGIHAAIWLFHTALLVPLAENLIYRQVIPQEAAGCSTLLIFLGSVLTYALAYAFDGGLSGLWFGLQFGIVLSALRAWTNSVTYPIVAHMIYGFAIESATLFQVLP